MKKLLHIAPEDDRDAISAFLVHKLSVLSSNSVDDLAESTANKYLLQEIFHAISAASHIHWNSHQESIIKSIYNVIR
jgi:DNA topoisomerase VI subunit B